jgi:2-polyprenyl-6-methoxyphenol hydroxylase-like FAD-dependent oxidoreductase
MWSAFSNEARVQFMPVSLCSFCSQTDFTTLRHYRIVLDRSAGDIIVIGPSAIGAFRHWPDMVRELENDQHESTMSYYRHTGELILGPTHLGFNDSSYTGQREGHPLTAPHQVRRKFFQMLLRQVARIGLKVEYGQQIESYFEDKAARVGGVITKNGTIRVADVVVAADANKTNSAFLIAGSHPPTVSSGMSVYRTSFPTDLAMQNEAFRNRWGEAIAKDEISHEFWTGPGIHMGLLVSREFTAYGITPRDSTVHKGGIAPIESWKPNVDPSEVVKVLRRLPDWDPAIEGLVSATPKGRIIHWPLLWRNLRREWTSKGGHVVQVGEAAHSSLPASASGGTLAIEDAVTLAACLQLACATSGASGAPTGNKIYNLLRYERVSCAQKMAFVNAEALGDADMDEIKQHPDKIRVRFPKWLFHHDPEEYVYEKYGQAFAHVVLGAKFQNTNLPPGHVFKSWTIEEIRDDARSGKRIEEALDGDWS